jgi:NAD+ synthase
MEEKISNWLKEYLEKNNLDCFVVGISGGIDSSLTSTLCAMSGIKTIVVSLPIHQFKDQLQRAHNHIKWLKDRYQNVEDFEFDLSETFEVFKKLFNDSNDLALANSRSRLRMVTLYQISGMRNGLVVGTGNKIEDFGIGFFTKYGDGGVDISPIADFTKTEVRTMSKNLGILNEIILASPTDGLWDDCRTDEQQIGATYEELEWAMNVKLTSDDDKKILSDRQKEVLSIYTKLNSANRHKMTPLPIFKR